MYIYVLGREKNICLAELEARLANVELINDDVASSEKLADINTLGGSIKVAETIKTNIRGVSELEEAIIDNIKATASNNSNKKFSFGLSIYGKNKIRLSPFGIKLKRTLQKDGLKPRLVLPKSENALNAASIKHNKLLGKGMEFIIVQNNDSMDLARSIGVQDIDSYSRRDYDKPCRDRKIGMLPPKLSQIMINLSSPKPDSTIIDPFCGSGGLLMEASLMGYNSIGSDLSDEMTSCSKINTDWFKKEFKSSNNMTIESAEDATKKTYDSPSYSIVTEGFLGTNFLSKPTINLVREQLTELKNLYLDFFKNLLSQKTLPNSVCICFPFWKFDRDSIELNLIDEIVNLGYTITEFKSVRRSILSYHREGQFTGRQIIVFKPNKEK